MLTSRPVCKCRFDGDQVPSWVICGACYPMVLYRPEMVLGVESNAARRLFNWAYRGVPDYFFVTADGSIIVGKQGVRYVRSISGKLFERGTIDESGNWQSD